MNYKQAKKAMPLAPRNIEVLEMLGWKWEPKYEDYFVTKDDTIIRIPRDFKIDRNMLLIQSHIHPNYPNALLMENITPILHWENDIEPILEKAGYLIEVYRDYLRKPSPHIQTWCRIWNKEGNETVRAKIFGKSCQEAVMLAVDVLGKELKLCD